MIVRVKSMGMQDTVATALCEMHESGLGQAEGSDEYWQELARAAIDAIYGKGLDHEPTNPPEGPWWMDEAYDGLATAWTGSRAILCACPDTGQAVTASIVAHTTRGWPDGGLAIARLIAAAPELYAALFELVEYQPNMAAHEQGQAALAKARGDILP